MLKNYISLVLFFSFFINNLTAQTTVTIPDPNFEQALIDLGIDSDKVINQTVLYSDIEYVSSLDVSDKEISDLTGIYSFTDLSSLDCSSNMLTSLDLPSQLVSLDCSSNRLTTLQVMRGELSSLDCSANLFETLSIKSTFLKSLKINQNPNLTTLVIINNNKIPNMTWQNDGGLSSVTISQNPNLSSITCSNNVQLSSLDIDNNPNLNNLELFDLYALTSLNLSQNISLTSLSLWVDSFKSLTSLDLSQTSLIDVNLFEVPLTSLVVPLSLRNLNCNGCYFTSLDLSQTNINSVELVNTRLLTSLNLGQNSSLGSLYIENSALTSLDLSQNPNLSNLQIKYNDELTYLDLRNGNNTLLTSSSIVNNPLLTCIFVDNATAANDGQEPYTNWTKDDSATYRTESCDFDIVLSTDKTALLENGEQAIITATLNQINPTEDVTIKLVASGSASITNYTLSSNTIIIPSGQLTATVTITANDDDMDSDKTVIIDVESVEKADELTNQQLTFTINHINNAPTDIALSNLTIDENSIIGTEIGIFTSTDIDSEDTFIYTLVSGDGDNDNTSFTITDNQLLSGKVFDFEIKNSYSIRVQTDDGNGGTYSKSLTVSINNLNTLFVQDSSASLRFINDIILKLESSETIKGFQFDITFPDGFVFDPIDLTNIGLPENFQVSCSNVESNTFRVIGFSLTNETIASGTTSIITFPTFIDEGTPIGEYPIPVFNVTLSDVNNLDIAALSPTDGIVTVYAHPRGDANGDNTVNVLDILGVIDYIFGNPPSVFNLELVDINSDDTINILDVLGIQDVILNQTAKTFDNGTKVNASKSLAGDNYLNITNDMFSPNTSETMEINLVNEDIVKGLEFNFVLPEGFTFNPADIVGSSRLNGFTISAQEISQNTYKVLIFSLSSATVALGTGAILNLSVFIEPDVSIAVYPIEFTNVVISDTNNTDISTQAPNIGEITINTLGIDNLENKIRVYPNPVKNILTIDSGFEGGYEMYDLNGRNVGKGNLLLGYNEVNTSLLQSGLYIMKISNDRGTVIKKFMKK